MNRERDIFLEALEQPSPEAQAALVERATAGDPRLREAVAALLANHQADAFLEQGAAGQLREALEDAGKLTPPEERIGDAIGRYRLLEKIGEGGFGVVYRAEQREPVRRHVAVKVIKLGMDTKSIVDRFQVERQALALMDHPGIARVLDGGATGAGRPYFVMELVRGVRITDYCRANQLALTDRLTLFIELCHAIQHAHQKGVIHRDIKPSNVLVTVQDGKPIPKVIDFGVAKAIEEPLTENTVLTNFHAFIGTPAYTSPEQAEMTGADVDTRSDIYSLGVVLYELLTGVTPFDAKELTQSGLDGMRRTIKEIEPPRPSTRVRRSVTDAKPPLHTLTIDRDLDWIVMKCLEKDRTRRYETVRELAADLQRYLNQEPVWARPQSTVYRLGKALRRHRAAFAAATGILLVVVAGSTISVWQALRATRAERIAEMGRRNEELLRHHAESERARAVENQARAELDEYVADVNLAYQSINAGNLARAGELLAKHRTTGDQRFEWRYLSHLAQGNDRRVLAQEPTSVLSLASSAQWLAVGLPDAVHIYGVKSGGLVKTLDHAGHSIALSAGGMLAAVSLDTIHVWRTTDWAELYSLAGHMPPVAFSPDGGRLAVNSPAGVEVYDSSNGRPVASIPNSMPPFAFSPRAGIIAVDTSGGIALWDLDRAAIVRVLAHSERRITAWMQAMNSLAFSPDGNSIIAARNTLRDGSIFSLDVWSAATGEKIASLPAQSSATEHSGLISSVAFAPGGRFLASGSHDHSIRVWDLDAQQCVERLFGNPAEVWAVAFTSDGQRIISGAKDGAVYSWPTNAVTTERLVAGDWSPIKISGQGRTLAAVDRRGTLGLLNLKTGEWDDQFQLENNPRPVWGGAISDDFRVLVDALPGGEVRVWDLPARKFRDLKTEGRHPTWMTLSPDGRTLLTGEGPDSLLWWNLLEPSEAPTRLPGISAHFSRNGWKLVMLGDKSVQVLNPNTRALQAEFPMEINLDFLTSVAVSDDGDFLAVGSNPFTETENAIRLWDLRSGKPLGVCKGHTQGVRWLAFAPDGETLASASDDSTLRFWNVRTQQELLAIRRLADPIRDIIFSPDGNWLVAKTADGLRLLDGSQDPTAGNAAAAGRPGAVP